MRRNCTFNRVERASKVAVRLLNRRVNVSPGELFPRRWRRIVWAVLLLFTLAMAGTVYGARSPNRYACLRFANDLLVDLNTGTHITDPRQNFTSSATYRRIPSPDGEKAAFLKPAARSARLFIEGADDSPAWVSDNVIFLEPNSWSPDSQRLAYMIYENENSRVVITGVQPGSPQAIIPVLSPTFLGWSPDSAYVALLEGNPLQRQLAFWSAPALRHTSISPNVTFVSGMAWSSTGHQLALVWQDTAQNRWFSFVSPDSAEPTKSALPKDSFDHRLAWSPDNRFVAVWYHDEWPRWRIDILGVQGESYLKVTETAQVGGTLSQPLIVWSADSGAVTFVEAQGNERDLVVYRLGQPRPETLVGGLEKAPVFAPDKRRMAVYERVSAKASITLMDVDGGQRVPLVQDADEAGDPLWSPDGRTVAAVWATGQRDRRVARLSWAHPDGSDLHVVDDGFQDVRDLRWLIDGKTLAYVARRSDGFSVETVDLNAGTITHLMSGLAQVTQLAQDARTGQITFWWRQPDGSVGYDAYRPDGQRLYRLRSSGQIDDERRLYWSPDGRTAAVRLGTRGSETLQLVSRDGQARTVRFGLVGLGDPLWSPDSWALAFTQVDKAVYNGNMTLEVVTSEGEDVRRFGEYRGVYANLSWTRCD
jgi:Tol biopolymer transport system component